MAKTVVDWASATGTKLFWTELAKLIDAFQDLPDTNAADADAAYAMREFFDRHREIWPAVVKCTQMDRDLCKALNSAYHIAWGQVQTAHWQGSPLSTQEICLRLVRGN